MSKKKEKVKKENINYERKCKLEQIVLRCVNELEVLSTKERKFVIDLIGILIKEI